MQIFTSEPNPDDLADIPSRTSASGQSSVRDRNGESMRKNYLAICQRQVTLNYITQPRKDGPAARRQIRNITLVFREFVWPILI
jgi:hypothetical protein